MGLYSNGNDLLGSKNWIMQKRDVPLSLVMVLNKWEGVYLKHTEEEPFLEASKIRPRALFIQTSAVEKYFKVRKTPILTRMAWEK